MPYRTLTRAANRATGRLGWLRGAVGSVLGLGLSFALTRQAASLLYEIAPTDPVAFGAALLAVLAVALGSSLLPARAAARLDPLTALRSE